MGRRDAWGAYGQIARMGAIAAVCLLLANCSSPFRSSQSNVDVRYGVPASPRVVEAGRPVPRGGGTRRVGQPYTVAGRTYVPQDYRRYRAEGLASWYGHAFHGRRTANGEIFDMNAISAAHPTMPIPSYARVTNLTNGHSLMVRVNDRGPYHGNRVIDLSHRSAQLLGFRERGVAPVRVEYVGPARLEGSNDRALLATLRNNGQAAPPPSRVMLASAQQPSAVASAASARYPERYFEPASAASSVSAQRAAPHRGAAPQPVSAFAPSRYDAGAGVMTGRGLY